MSKRTIWIKPTAETRPGEGPGNLQGRGNLAETVQGYTQIAVEELSKELRGVIDAIAGVLKPQAGGPESCQAKFGLKLNSKGGVILAEVGGEVSLEVTVTWKR